MKTKSMMPNIEKSFEIDFYTKKVSLTNENKQFSKEDLAHIRYDQLILCCIGNAGRSRCSFEDVIVEKRRRRIPFLTMTDEELELYSDYLNQHGMYEDVIRDHVSHSGKYLNWDQLSPIQKLYFKSMCITNHLDLPEERMKEAKELLDECRMDGWLPDSVAEVNQTKMEVLLSGVNRLSLSTIKKKMDELANVSYEFMNVTEQGQVNQGIVLGYVCSQGCFSPINLYL